MKNYTSTSIAQEIPKDDIQNTVVTIKVPGQPIREFKGPAIVMSIEEDVATATYAGTGPEEILKAVISMINIFRSIADEEETLILGNLLCSELENIMDENKKTTGGVH